MMNYRVRRARPSDAGAIARFVAEATHGRVNPDRGRVLDRLGSKGLWLVEGEEGIVGLAGWRTENLVARIDDFLVHPPALRETAGAALLEAIEEAARELQCEVAMIYVPPGVAPGLRAFWERQGYHEGDLSRAPKPWQEAAGEALQQGRSILFKQLREDLVMRPL